MTLTRVKGSVWNTADNKLGFNVVDFGATGDGSTDDTTALQNTINAAESAGGGEVVLFEGTFIVNSPIVLPSQVILQGDGEASTIIKAGASFTGTAVIKSKDFDSLTGSNTWFVSEGINFAFGLRDLRIDGDLKAVRGTQIYGKRFYVDDISVVNCNNGGWYSEAGFKVGQTETNDMPESDIGHVFVKECGAISFEYNGPHDGKIEYLSVAGPTVKAGTTALKFGELTNVYSGICDMVQCHVFSVETGVNVEALLHAGQIISENCEEIGLILARNSAIIDRVNLFQNSKSGTFPNISCTSESNTISAGLIADQNGGGAISCTGNFNNFGNMVILGGNTAGLGLDLQGFGNIFSGSIRAYDQAGGTALRTNNAGANTSTQNIVNLTVNNCETVWNNVNLGEFNSYTIVASLLAGQSTLAGQRPDRENREEVNIFSNENGTKVSSKFHGISTDAVDLNSTLEQNIIINHGMFAQPYLENVSIDLARSTAVTNFDVDYMRVVSTTTTQITAQIKLGTATGTPGDVASMLFHAEF